MAWEYSTLGHALSCWLINSSSLARRSWKTKTLFSDLLTHLVIKELQSQLLLNSRAFWSILAGSSFFCCLYQELVANGHYQTFLLLTILASTIQLLLESPIKSEVKGVGRLVYLLLWSYRRLLAPRICSLIHNNHTFVMICLCAGWNSSCNLISFVSAWIQSIITESSGLILNYTFLVIFFTEFLLKALLHGIYW